MIILVIGGSSSGKSKYAEQCVLNLGEKRVYIATMQAYDKEAERRIKAHRNMRAEKNFDTIEQYVNVNEIEVDENTVVLIECVSNLLANEMCAENAKNVEKKICEDISVLAKKCEHLVIVTNEVFSDGASYDDFCKDYINYLGDINAELAKLADEVVEVVVGIPLVLKSNEEKEHL